MSSAESWYDDSASVKAKREHFLAVFKAGYPHINSWAPEWKPALPVHSKPVGRIPVRVPAPSLPPAALVSTREEKVDDKPQYSSSGMQGFTEDGPDDGWDMALGSVRGYRWWNWDIPAYLAGYADFPRVRTEWFACPLVGANSYSWDDGRIEATCNKPAAVPTWDDLITQRSTEHEVPEYRVTCGCGFWAYWPPDGACPVGARSRTPTADYPYVSIPVFGSVRASGRVILGKKGFRAQYAQVEALCLPEGTVKGRLSQWRTRPRDSGLTQTVWAATHEEVLSRQVTLETMLGDRYRSATIMSSQELLVRAFPPEPDYYDSRPVREMYP